VAYKHNALLAEKRSAIQSVLVQTFPNVTVIVDAPLQMQREVDALARARGTEGADLARLLTAVSGVLGRDKPILAVDYAAGALRLRASGVSGNDAATLASVLGAQGWTAELQGDQLIVQAKGGR
jgi:general secretion pathway protein L